MNVWVNSSDSVFSLGFFLFGIKVNNGKIAPLSSRFIEKI